MTPFTTPLTGNGPAYREISERIRNAILDGELASGTRIPPALEMARQLKASVCTVQAALSPLVKEGLIERRQRLGTFVRNRVGALGGIGIYFSSDFWTGAEMDFYRELQKELFRELQQQGGRPMLWIDVRPKEEQTEPLSEIVSAIQHREVQGMIGGLLNEVDIKWISQLKVPISAFSTGNLPSSVNIDLSNFFELGFQELQRKGCRSLAIIYPKTMPEIIKAAGNSAFVKNLPESAARYGLRLTPAWMRIPPVDVDNGEFEAFGYRQFKEIWSQTEHPDGLLVFPDVVARGVVTAILETGVSVPEQLKLVMHRNVGVSFLNPLPTSWLVASVRQVALTLVEQLRRQIEGKGVRPISLPMAIETY